MKFTVLSTIAALLLAASFTGCAPLPNEACAPGGQCEDDQPPEELAPPVAIITIDTSVTAEHDPLPEEVDDEEEATPSCELGDGSSIDAHQLPLVLDTPVARTSWVGTEPVQIDLSGSTSGGSGRVWHFDQELEEEIAVYLEAESAGSHWFALDYPDATFVTRIAGTATMLGIYQRTLEHILLLGIASRDGDATTRTQITYDPPVEVIRFPLQVGDTHTTESSAHGQYEGVPFYFAQDVYSISIDAAGTVVTPVGEFPALRVYTERTLTIPLAFYPFQITTHHKQYGFIAPCLGEIVHVTSHEGEADIEFSSAPTLERVALITPTAGGSDDQ